MSIITFTLRLRQVQEHQLKVQAPMELTQAPRLTTAGSLLTRSSCRGSPRGAHDGQGTHRGSAIHGWVRAPTAGGADFDLVAVLFSRFGLGFPRRAVSSAFFDRNLPDLFCATLEHASNK